MGVDRLDSEAERLSAARGLREVAKPILLLTEANARPSEEREGLDLGAWGSVAPRRVERLPREQQGLREIVLGPRQLRVAHERKGEHRSALDPQRLRRPKHRVARFGALALDPERRGQLEIDVRAVPLVARKVARAEQHVLGLVSAPRRSECGPELEKHVDFLRDAGALSRGQPEMIDRRVIGTYRDRATGRIASVRDGLRVVARGGEVAGEGRMEPIVAELFERLAHAEVEPRPPLIRDRARDRVASERVAEHVHLPLRGRAFGQQRFGHALNARGVERLESDTSESALAIELGHERTQRMGRTDIFLAVGEEDADPAVKRRREIAQKVAARGIGLMEIVEHDKDRTKRGGVLEEEMDRAKESLATLVVRDRPLV